MNSSRPMCTAMLVAAALLVLAGRQAHARPTEYYLPERPQAILRFAAIDPARNPVDEQWLLEELTAALQTRSTLPLTRSGQITPELSGLRTHLDREQSRIVFEYIHVARNRFGNEWGETLTIPVPYRVERTNVLFLVHLEPAELAIFATPRAAGVFFLPAPKLKPLEEIFADFAAVIRGADSLELHHAFLFSGELETVASPRKCVEKLDYAFGRYAYAKNEDRIFDTKNDDVFMFRTVRESIPLKIATMEYGGATSISYQARLPYTLRADGTVEGYDLPFALKTAISQVLEDTPTRAAQGTPEGGDGALRDLRR
jgi:hypothetical protein